ncbi:hypothetical protein [Klebsiella pneumoniae]|uniref:hypothetical protein n=1 Tax=Klebsiella pneumoniae TaxID=573 RepID=UPI001887A3EC|nr:hypothetical protein [Klebsiella pneumoniae]MBF1945877.1 hypothetical protein [Klebsiella pneumoniae]
MIEVGTYCIHTSKWGRRDCRVVAHDGGTVVIKNLGSGYPGVPETFLTVVTELEAKKFASAQNHPSNRKRNT